LAFAFCVERVVNNEFAVEDFMIAQPQCTEAAGNPAQPFARWMRITRARIGCADNFAE